MLEENEMTWLDIRNRLKPDEAAVEFSEFRYEKEGKISDSSLYFALVLRKKDTVPNLVALGDEKTLIRLCPPAGNPKAIDKAYSFQGNVSVSEKSDDERNTLYDFIWKPIDRLLTGIKTVYYAPSGLLNRVSFAAIPVNGRTFLVDRYSLVQLSSTRLLVLPQEPQRLKDAIVYGGIFYDADTALLRDKGQKYHQKEAGLLAYNRSWTGNSRAGFKFLPGTKKESELIGTRLNQKGIATTILSGMDAMEESFASLSGPLSPSLIHLSTHGFYFPDTLANENRKNITYTSGGDIQFRYSGDPLLRSGLLMTGANLTWKGLPGPDGMEDGILTAREVSNMNLMNTQLVVLSACQTGLGDVNGSEGVEGLQRGFKMAGAKYILMSLWKVPDNETTGFMVAFYDSWLSGKNFRDAFHVAQVAMKTKYPGEPFKWAGFVLVE
jgi:CHAT domain-containing protein